jgi:hypothetical protein
MRQQVVFYARTGRAGQAHIDLFVPQHNPLFRATTGSNEATERTRSRHRADIVSECERLM